MSHLKTLGVVIVAALALGTVGAAAAFADAFTAEKYPTVLTGSGDPGFTDELLTTGGVLKCTTPRYVATISGATTSFTATPSFSGCTTAGVPSTATMSGCTLKFNLSGSSSTTGDADIICPAGVEPTITVTPPSGTHPCTKHIKAQSDITGTITYSNIGAGATREITVNAQLTGIDYTHTTGTGLAMCTSGSGTNGTWNFKAIFTGESHGGGHVGFFLSSL